MSRTVGKRPSYDRLFATAVEQDGFFTTSQAAEAGYSDQLLHYLVATGRAARALRGVYRLVHFPAGEHEELVTAWLWSDRKGVVSHQTALALHRLSDVLPAHVHLSVPAAWRRRRLRVPADLVLHHADVPRADRTWFGAVPTTNPRRTLNDAARAGLSPELLRQAAEQALRRGLVAKAELMEVERALEPFGGFAA